MRKLLFLVSACLLGYTSMYSQSNMSGADPCSDADCPLEFSSDLTSYEVQCAEDLPSSCEDYLSDNMIVDFTAYNSCSEDEYDVFCTGLIANTEVEGGESVHTVCEAVTAKYNSSLAEGEYGYSDGALRLYGLHTTSGITDSDFFVEDPSDPLTFLHTPSSGTARLTGTVHCRENASQIFHIDALFIEEQNAVDWLAADAQHQLLVQGLPGTCTVDTSEVQVFKLSSASYLVADGDLSGVIQLSHAPISYSRLFQLGDGVNNHNCNYGLGGWFSWNGVVNETNVSGTSGDLVLDLAPCVESTLTCEEYSEFVFTAIDLDCGRVLSTTVRVDRNDTEAPVVVSGPASVTVECDAIPAVADISDVIAEDNCTGDITIVYTGESPATDIICPNSYSVARKWNVTDACGNSTIHTQILTIQDTTAPELTALASDASVECDGSGNASELQAWLDSNGGATATDNCGAVTWSNDFSQAVTPSYDMLTGTETDFIQDDDDNSEEHSLGFDFTFFGNTFSSIHIGSNGTLSFTDTDEYCCSGDPVDGGDYENVIAFMNTDLDPGDQDDDLLLYQTLGSAPNRVFVVSFNQAPNYDDTSLRHDGQVVLYEGSNVIEIYYGGHDWTLDDEMTIGISNEDGTEGVAGAGWEEFEEPVSATMFVFTPNGSSYSLDISTEGSSLSDDCGATGSVTVDFTAHDECQNFSSSTATFTIEDTTHPELVSAAEITILCEDYPNDIVYATASDDCGDVEITFSDIIFSGGCLSPGAYWRTYTATDACGNISTSEQYVELVDNTSPDLTVPVDYSVDADASCNADISEVLTGQATATDNCSDDVDLTFSDSDWSYDCEGDDATPEGTRTLIRTWTATDECDNASTDTQSITVFDHLSPVGSVEDADVECSDYDATMAYGTYVANDNCDTDVAATWENIGISNEEGAGCYSVLREYTFTDDCGNSSTAEQTINVVDTSAPVFDAYDADIEVECTGEDPEDINYLPLTATDNCSAITFSVTSVCASGGCLYRMIRTWTATDECGNSTETEQFVGLIDLTAPVLTVPALFTVSADPVNCDADISTTVAGEATATDNCGPNDCWGQASIAITHEDSDWTYDCAGDDNTSEGTRTKTRTWTATDRCGNSTSGEQIITVEDVTTPVGSTEDADVACSDYDATMAYGSYSSNDNCDTDVAATWENIEIFNELGAGCYSVLREYTFIDDCGNSSTAEQTITVFDAVGPVFTGEPQKDIECSEYPDDSIYVVADDACGGEVVITFDDVEQTGACVKPIAYYVRTYTATDECGNTNTFEQILTLVDSTNPVLTTPADYSIECDQVVVLDTATATDNCDSEVDLQYSEEQVAGCGSTYVLTRTWIATDDCDNSSTGTQTITVVDTTAPVVTPPDDLESECSESYPEHEATATDNCAGDITITEASEITAGTCTGDYIITRTFTATDECGNHSSASQTITIIDTTAPVLSIPADYTAECSNMPALEEATAADNCGTSSVTLVTETTPGDCTGSYTISRTWTAIDDCGNSSMATQTITIEDTTGPVFTLDPQVYISCELYPNELSYATAEDNCGTATVSFSDAPGSGGCVLPYGQFIRTYTATDDCGNVSNTTQIITLFDTTAPVFTSVPEDYTVECDQVLVLDDATAEDNCSGAVVTVGEEIVTGACPSSYMIIRTFTATDNCVNASTATQTITVVDTTAPVITNDAEVSVACGDYSDALLYATAADNCGESTLTFVDVAAEGGCVLPVGQYDRTYTAIDACGNVSVSTQLIVLTDEVNPEFTSVPADYATECDAELLLENATATDNCSGVTIAYSEAMSDGDCAHVYTLVRTWTATDGCGNFSTVSQTISVDDTTAPQLTTTCDLLNGEVVQVCCDDLSGSVTIPAACDISFTDNCDSEATFTLTETCVGDNCPTDAVSSWCDIVTPEALADGETCDNYAAHSMRLFNFDDGSEFYTTIGGRVANNTDGSQTYTLTVAGSDNAAAGWVVTLEYPAAMDWATWSTQPGAHSFKSDCGLGDHTTWLYSEMTSGSATGWGEYAGSELTLNHQPANGYFGFQIGEGANNKNSNYGFSGWIYYSGMFQGDPVNGSGDIFGDLDCCLPYDISRNYTVSDCADNITNFGYTVSVTGEACEEADGGIVGNNGGDNSNTGLVTLKDLIVIESLMPNPTSDNTTLVFETGDDIAINISLMTMSGSLVKDLFQGSVFSNTPMTLEISTSNLDAGMYQVRVHSRDFVVTKKLLVTN